MNNFSDSTGGTPGKPSATKKRPTMHKWLTYGLLCIVMCGVGCKGNRTEHSDPAAEPDSTEHTDSVRIRSIHEECWNYSRGKYRELSYTETIEYESNGQEKCLTIKYGNGSSSVTTYVYEDGRPVERNQKTSDGQTFTVTYGYDEDGRVQTLSDVSRTKPIERYEYNGQGLMEWKYSYDGESDSPIFANRYEYDDKGHMSLELQYNDNGEELQERHIFEYDDKGYLRKEEFLGRFDGDIHITYEYTAFDEEGNWTECIKTEKHDDGNEYKSKTIRKYTYQ